MKTFFTIYLIGFIISGIFIKIMYMIESFYEYRNYLIDEAKAEINYQDLGLSDDVTDNDSVIRTDIILTMFMSYLGILHTVIAAIGWIVFCIANKN